MEPTLTEYVAAVDEALLTLPLLTGAQGMQAKATKPDTDSEVPEPLRSAMRYSLTLPGKRLRPTLLLASYRLIKPDWYYCGGRTINYLRVEDI